MPDFFRAVGMKYVAITCSNKNPADQETLEALAAQDAAVYQTAQGSIRISSTPAGISLRQS